MITHSCDFHLMCIVLLLFWDISTGIRCDQTSPLIRSAFIIHLRRIWGVITLQPSGRRVSPFQGVPQQNPSWSRSPLHCVCFLQAPVSSLSLGNLRCVSSCTTPSSVGLRLVKQRHLITAEATLSRNRKQNAAYNQPLLPRCSHSFPLFRIVYCVR